MGVIRTDKWLTKNSDPENICKRLKRYFPEHSESEVQHHLIMHGMYKKADEEDIKALLQSNPWPIVKEEFHYLKDEWNGPDVPILILPSDPDNEDLHKSFNGKSGLAFKDKLFLFVCEKNSRDELRALLTHEYHHVCRLNALEKEESSFTLLDSIVMEGLAENAVRDRLGEEHQASWANRYDEKELNRIWRVHIQPRLHLPKSHPRHYELLHGGNGRPKRAGYAAGCWIVKNYMDEHKKTAVELLHTPAEEMLPQRTHKEPHPFMLFFKK